MDYSELRDLEELEKMEYFVNTQGSLFKLTKDEFDFIMDMIREENPAPEKIDFEFYDKNKFLDEVYLTPEKYNALKTLLLKKQNIILQGAPGVGKTFAVERLAYSIMGEKDENWVEFIQFHQNILRQNGKVLIIDAKYYTDIMQSHYDIKIIRSGNIYQIYTYVKNLDKENTGKVKGMLLYAKTEEQIQPNSTFSMGGNKISVKTLDLNLDFEEIANQLDTIVKNYFG